jgi:hypothetical protein
MMRWVAVVLLSGCSSILGIDDFKVGDAGGGESMDGDTGYCLGPPGWRLCVPTMPTTPRMIDSSLQFDTENSPLCFTGAQPAAWKAAGQPDACFIIGGSVTFAAPQIQASGRRPLVVFASGVIAINTQLDVASHLTSVIVGPSSPSALCGAPQPAGNGANNNPGAGGAGGSFGSKGGDGGNSSTATILGGRSAAAAAAPMILRAGCNGGVGGNASEMGGPPGVGGGAVYLVAGERITINGFINASGSAGEGGGRNGGGGGGGSGGMIHLHAPVITGNAGVLIANGGGGGEGGDGSLDGLDGRDPTPSMPDAPALGGTSTNAGAPGGNGSARSTPAAGGANGPAGAVGAGGGGGGGAGYIRVNVMPTQVQASPAFSLVP